MLSSEKIACDECEEVLIKKNLTTHYSRRHRGKVPKWKCLCAKEASSFFKNLGIDKPQNISEISLQETVADNLTVFNS